MILNFQERGMNGVSPAGAQTPLFIALRHTLENTLQREIKGIVL